jgi:asparagine synthase (glutamine-hydrolysing)
MDRLIGQVSREGGLLKPESPPGGVADAVTSEAPGFWCEASAAQGRATEVRHQAFWCACVGAAYASEQPAAVRRGNGVPAVISCLQGGTASVLAGLAGEFLLAAYDARDRTLLLATDHFGTIPLYYVADGEVLSFGTDLDWVSGFARNGPRLRPQALYDYLFFSVVPDDKCIFEGVRKLPPGSALRWRDGRVSVARYWHPDFRRHGASDADLREQTIAAVSAAVARLADLPDAGCFLSGGLDSSTVCGMAARHLGSRTPVFTIGFDVPEYDERQFARTTARHFGLTLHEQTVRSRDISGCAGRVIAAFSEPFGNPSALPAYLCARLARDAGVRHMLAGDGGDELFAGNERYQKQLLFNLYGNLPAVLRHAVVDPLAGISARAPAPLRKLASYVRQARVPLPDRLFSYNLLVRNRPDTVLTGDFLAGIDTESPYEYARAIFRAPADGDALDRMMFLDWTTTLTDNDLPKVCVTAAQAGVDVHFPLLDPGVVRISTLIPSRAKLTLRELRKFYKQVFAAFLPAEVIRKRKHGFGVPVGIWINNDAELRERLRSRLDALGRRGIVRRTVIGELLALQAGDHASYYGSLIWPLFALEEWLQSRGL